MDIRDYPTPLLTLESFSAKGLLIGSEACGVERGTVKPDNLNLQGVKNNLSYRMSSIGAFDYSNFSKNNEHTNTYL